MRSRARPCGFPSMMSINTTSPRPFSSRRIAAVWPTKPLPTTVVFMTERSYRVGCDQATEPLRAPSDSSAVSELGDHGVGDAEGAGGGPVIPHGARQDQPERVGSVGAGKIVRGPVRRLEDRQRAVAVAAEMRPGGHTGAPDQPGAELRHQVAV